MPKTTPKGEAKASPLPEHAKYVRVDEIIECYAISRDTEKALLLAMPDAYGGELPGEDDWPEPDAKRDEPYKLSKIWAKLSDDVRADIAQAIAKRWEDWDA